MGVLARLRAWWRRRFGSGDAGADAPAGYECAVCGTGVDGPAGACPLCRSTDVVLVGTREGGSETDVDVEGEPARGGPGSRRVDTDDGASVDRLRELRADGEVLERHADRWRSVEGGFRVETSDGTRSVDSREEVVALLRAEDG